MLKGKSLLLRNIDKLHKTGPSIDQTRDTALNLQAHRHLCISAGTQDMALPLTFLLNIVVKYVM